MTQVYSLPDNLKVPLILASAVIDLIESDISFYPVEVPDGVSGNVKVLTKSVSYNECLIQGQGHMNRYNPWSVTSPGEYKVLVVGGGVMMSNTQLEHRTNRRVINRMEGDVLVTGLGLGSIITPITSRSNVKSLTIVEKNKDVISLVAPYYSQDSKVRIVEGDAFSYIPDQKYDFMYHDIWPSLNGNEEEMKVLGERYQTYAKVQEFWMREEMEMVGKFLRDPRMYIDWILEKDVEVLPWRKYFLP